MEERVPSPVVVHPQQLPPEQSPTVQRSRRRQALVPPTVMHSMRTAMPHFVSALRVVDDWKRQHASRAEAITQAEYDVSAKFVKSAFARSARVEDLSRFVDDTELDIDFMVQLPSIEKCLERWWRTYARESKSVDQDKLRAVFYDLATVLVEAKTENVHKNSVSMVVRGAWAKWSSKEAPLSKPEFFRLLFILAHLMTTSNRLNDYVVFLQETLARIMRVQQSKAMRSAARETRKPRARRKPGVLEIMSDARSGGPVIVPLAVALQGSGDATDGPAPLETVASGSIAQGSRGSLAAGANKSKPHSTAVSLPTVLVSRGGHMDDAVEPLAAGHFVEVLERNSRGQHVVVDPLVLELAFQRKWQRGGGGGGGGGDATKSMDAIAAERNPVTSAFAPPMMIHRLRASRSAANVGFSCREALGPSADAPKALAAGLTTGEEELLRRSLSRVTLKDRVARKKLAAASRGSRATSLEGQSSNERAWGGEKQPVQLTISP